MSFIKSLPKSCVRICWKFLCGRYELARIKSLTFFRRHLHSTFRRLLTFYHLNFARVYLHEYWTNFKTKYTLESSKSRPIFSVRQIFYFSFLARYFWIWSIWPKIWSINNLVYEVSLQFSLQNSYRIKVCIILYNLLIVRWYNHCEFLV